MGSTVTYNVDGTTYQEEIDEGASCLSPKSFALPTKSGYTFAGWSKSSGGAVLSSCIMGDAPVTLYAVWVANTLTVTGNTNYISTSGTMGAELWYAAGYQDNTAYININYAGYRSIKITIEVHVQNPNNCTHMSINGTEIYNKQKGVNKLTLHEVINGAAENIKYRWTGTFSGTKIPVRCYTENYGSRETWTSLRWSIVSAELNR